MYRGDGRCKNNGYTKKKKEETYSVTFFLQLLQKSPTLRLGHGIQGYQKLKSHNWFQGLDWDAIENKTAIAPFIPNVYNIIIECFLTSY
jgi:hypothetical protein